MTDLPPNALLRDIFDIPPVVSASDFVLQLQSGVDHADQTVGDYVATESLARSFDDALAYLGAAVAGNKPQGIFLHGSFGSGKSHFMAVLDLMLRGEPKARAIPGLQAVVAGKASVLDRKWLTVEYHLIGAKSLEDAVLSGFARRIAELHPDRPTPMLHKSDRLFADASGQRSMDETQFFTRLNSDASGDDGWGNYGGGWTTESYHRAAAAPPNDPDRARLAADLVRTMFTGYAAAGEWLDIADGLDVMATTAKELGYDGLVLFLDELVLWLASHASDAAFVSSEASKVAKFVETGLGERAVPIVSFVARQRELSDFIGDRASGVQRAQVGQTIQYWEDRFDTITLSAANLPDVAQKRLLQPRSPEASAQINKAVAAVKASDSWNVLLQDESQSDEAAFAKVYPFSPALVDVLVALSGRLQRERTALKVMALLLSARRDSGHINEVIGVGDLYDQMVASGDQPLTDEMRQLFDTARSLYSDKFLPVLLSTHGLPAIPEDATHQFHKDARLAKTLIVAAMTPEVKSLSTLTAGRLAALNHGTVAAFIPGEEGTQVLHTVRIWAQQIGAIHIGDGNDPVISVELSGVDYDSVLGLVENEDTPGQRRRLLKELVFAEMGIEEPAQVSFGMSIDRIWRGTKRRIDIVFGNIRDVGTMPDSQLLADGDRWKLLIDYPFDDGDHGPQEDVNRIDELRHDGTQSRTVGWVPYFLTAERQADLGQLVLLEHLLGGSGAQFDANASHLPVEQRAQARSQLENMRRAKTEIIKTALRQAYGIEAPNPANVDATGYGEIVQFPTLWREEPLGRPAKANLSSGLTALIDQMLTIQYPDHPEFDPPDKEVRSIDLKHVWEVVEKAADSPNGRLDPVDPNRRQVMRRIARPLGLGFVGEAHFVFDNQNFEPLNDIVRLSAQEGYDDELPVSAIREWLAPRGITRDMGNLIIACFARLQDKLFQLRGAVTHVADPSGISDEMVLVNPRLPGTVEWETATDRAGVLFGITAGRMRNAANVAALARDVSAAVASRRTACDDLIAVLRAHAGTLGLDTDSPRLRTAKRAEALLKGLQSAADDVTLVETLASLDLPDEPQALATSMSSALTVVDALRRQDWSNLDAAAGQAEADPDAKAALADLRSAAVADQLHADVLGKLGPAQQKATTWLLNRGGGSGEGLGRTGGGDSGGERPPQTDPDMITLSNLESQINTLSRDIEKALKARPGASVKITWELR